MFIAPHRAGDDDRSVEQWQPSPLFRSRFLTVAQSTSRHRFAAAAHAKPDVMMGAGCEHPWANRFGVGIASLTDCGV